MQSKLTWIKSQLLSNESANEAASRLNTPIETPNPTPQQQISVPIDLLKLREGIPDLEAFKVLSSPIWDRITEAIKKGDGVTIINHTKALLAGGLISQETVAKIIPLLQLTQPDPTWQATTLISPAHLAGFGVVLVSNVQEAINAT